MWLISFDKAPIRKWPSPQASENVPFNIRTANRVVSQPRVDNVGRVRYRPSLFRGRHFQDEVIVLCVQWYLRYSLSYRDLEEMMVRTAQRPRWHQTWEVAGLCVPMAGRSEPSSGLSTLLVSWITIGRYSERLGSLQPWVLPSTLP